MRAADASGTRSNAGRVIESTVHCITQSRLSTSATSDSVRELNPPSEIGPFALRRRSHRAPRKECVTHGRFSRFPGSTGVCRALWPQVRLLSSRRNAVFESSHCGIDSSLALGLGLTARRRVCRRRSVRHDTRLGRGARTWHRTACARFVLIGFLSLGSKLARG